MRMVRMEEEKELHEFVQKAAKSFSENPEFYTFTEGGIECGAFFALRYGLGDDCVVVFKISDEMEPVNFQNIIERASDE